MCWSATASIAMVGIGVVATGVTAARGEPRAIWLTLGYFTVMEALQATGYAFHPYRIENADEFVSGMSSLGYRQVDQWVSSELGPFMPRVANLTS